MKHGVTWQCILLAAVVTGVLGSTDGSVRLVDNGYEGLKIVIKDSVKENVELLERIKEVFTKASNFLFRATQNRAYFRNITIVVPKRWSKRRQYEQIPAVNVFMEHIRIDRKNKAKGVKPYVRGNLECGKPGWFLHLTPKFLFKRPSTKFGDHDKVIVHEWGHLRWGLFDEYASIDHPQSTKSNQKIHFYNEGGQWKPVTCSRNITGKAMSNCKKKKECNLKKIQLPGKCQFCPDKRQAARSSLMAQQWIKSLVEFCDEDSSATPGDLRHNSRAPNLQNKMCNGMSAWEVMRRHPDFHGGNNPPAPADTDTTPTFHVVQETGRVRVLVFDISGSMKGDKIQKQTQAAHLAIETLIEKGSQLGIVSFNEQSRIMAPMTLIKNKKARKSIKKKVPTVPGGGTHIYRGLAKAVMVIQNEKIPTQGTEIILLSDGESNYPYLTIIPRLQSLGITVNTIAITNAADRDMAILAHQTRGKSYTYLETDTVSFADVLGQAIETSNTDIDRPEKVLSETVTVAPATTVSRIFYIDEGLGNQTSISVFSSNSTSLRVLIQNDVGIVHNATHDGDEVSIDLPMNIESGQYMMYMTTVNSESDVKLLITVTSRPVSEDIDVVRVTSYLSNSTFDFSNANDVKLYANVEIGGDPVLNANVTAILAGEKDFAPVRLSMTDKGTGADAIPNDGVYSAFLLKKYFHSNMRYNVKIVVNGDGNAFSYVADMSLGSEAAVNPEEDDEEEIEYETVQLDRFYRQSLPGEINVINFQEETTQSDTTPPARVTDLAVENIAYNTDKSITYTLSWTAVGDDMDDGQASKYDIRMHPDIKTLRNSFKDAFPVPVQPLHPKYNGLRETLPLTLTDHHCNGTCFLAIQVYDASGLASELSNVVNVDVNFSYEAEEEVNTPTALSSVAVNMMTSFTTSFIVAILTILWGRY